MQSMACIIGTQIVQNKPKSASPFLSEIQVKQK